MKTKKIIPGLLGLISAATPFSNAQSPEKPNIIIIYADDLGYGDVSCYGATRLKTPNLDRLAEHGLRFTNAHCTSATSTPSRYSLLTGEYAWRRKGTDVLPGDASAIIQPGRITLATLMKSAGYTTGVVGKWHLGLGPAGGPDWNEDIKPGPMDIGFDYNFIIPATGDRVPCVFIEDNKSNPFFLYFSTHDIHVPRVPNERFAGKSGMGPRGDAILEFDWSVGEIVKTVVRLKLTKSTLIIVTSDNGPVVDDGYKDQAVELLGSHKPAGPLRGGKYSAFDGGTRVVLIAFWKGKIKKGVSDALFSQIDLMASFAELTGKSMPAGGGPDSYSHLNALFGKSQSGREWLVEHSSNGRLSIIKGDWKFIEPGPGVKVQVNTNTETGNDPLPQIYNLRTDIGEKNNLALVNQAIVKELTELLQRIKGSNMKQ